MLPTKADLLTLDYDDRGAPFVRAEAKTLGTFSLDYDDRGMPFAAIGASFQAAWARNANSMVGPGAVL